MRRIGIDLGGTKTEGVVIDESGTELVRRRVATPAGSYEAIVATIATLVSGLESAAGGGCRVGVGMPGAISPVTGSVKNANTTVLIGRPFVEDLSTALGRPVLVENDANCFALSEARDGAAAGSDPVFGVILGTGTGGGLVIGQRILRGANAIGGEWGHNPLPWPSAAEFDGRPCYCGKRACLETYLSGAGLRRTFLEFAGLECSVPEIIRRVQSGEPAAGAALRRYADQLARGLASVVNVVDPAVIVLGGGLSNITELYTLVPDRLRAYAFSDHLVTRLDRAKHGDSSGVRGAARLWDEHGEPAAICTL